MFTGKVMLIPDYIDEIDKLKQENQSLKKHLEVPEHCNLKTLEDYKSYYEDTTKEKILEDTYIDYCAYVNLAHRYSELDKQLENCFCNRTDCSGRIKDSKKYDSLEQKVENQQKDFIEYLENEIEKTCNSKNMSKCNLLQEILSKYKEITGNDINVGSNGGKDDI